MITETESAAIERRLDIIITGLKETLEILNTHQLETLVTPEKMNSIRHLAKRWRGD